MRRNRIKWIQWAKAAMLSLLLLAVVQTHAQFPVKSYSVKNGKMYIALGKGIPAASLDSFINKYELYDLDLSVFMRTGTPDSLLKRGWKIDINNNEVVVISKPLFGVDNINDPAERILITRNEDKQFEAVVNQVHFGANKFKNKQPFAFTDSTVTFFLRGQTNAAQVKLAGSFTSWESGALPMTKTDSGWTATVKIPAGKNLYKFIIDGNWRIDKDNAITENDGMGNDNSVYFKSNYTFILNGYTNAKKVILAGSFNNWHEKEQQMLRTAGGWALPVYLSEGTHTYRFIADGHWFADPANPDKLPNEYNDFNSVIRMGNPYLFKLDGFTDAKKVVLLGSFNGWKDGELLMNKTATGWELPYTLGAGNYEYRLKIDGQLTADSATNENKVLVIAPNFTFRLKDFPAAKKVCVAGDFNTWNPASFQMKREGNEWVYQVHLNKGKHLYKFIVDGEWILDPGNKLWEQNETGTGNSIVWIEKD